MKVSVSAPKLFVCTLIAHTLVIQFMHCELKINERGSCSSKSILIRYDRWSWTVVYIWSIRSVIGTGWNDEQCGCTHRPLCGGGGSSCDLVVGEEYMTWHKAEQWCIINTGCHLAIIQSDSENALAEELCNDCWIGATCSDSNDRTFHWVDDSDWEYTAWSSGEPNDGINPEDCVHIFDESTWKMCGNWWFSRLFIGIWSAIATGCLCIGCCVWCRRRNSRRNQQRDQIGGSQPEGMAAASMAMSAYAAVAQVQKV